MLGWIARSVRARRKGVETEDLFIYFADPFIYQLLDNKLSREKGF
jgi:hypothetical protein